MTSVIEFLRGKKAYLLGLAAIVYGVSGFGLGELALEEAAQYIWTGLTAMALRAGVSKANGTNGF